ncbi:MAG: DNRLRE domain-containing protein [Sedimentisphaerales bacterium]|nr:DNRLRE domain-containing protein [Sedimentisphaerales bacterium]
MMCKKILFLLVVMCAASAALADTVAYWRFDDMGIAGIDDPPGTVASGKAIPDSDGRTVWRMAAYDHSGNGNHLTSWDWAWAGHNWSDQVQSTSVPALDLANELCAQSAGSYPAIMTWSAQSKPTGVDLETWSPLQWTVEASFRPTSISGYRTVVGRDGRDVCTVNTGGVAEPALAPFYLSMRVGDGRFGVYYTDVSGYAHLAESAPGLISVNNWYNVAAVCNGQTLSLYINNVLVATNDLTTSGSPNLAMAIGNGSGADWTAGTWTVARGLYNGGHVDRVLGRVDEIRISNAALNPSEFLFSKILDLASNPSPANTATDVVRDPSLSWTAGQGAVKHDVYFGTDASNLSLLSSGQTDTVFDPGRLELEKTYYWRVDEIDESDAVTKGGVWRFTTEPVAFSLLPVNIINVTAVNDYDPENQEPNMTCDGSGLDANDMHSTDIKTMWLGYSDEPGKVWIQYEFDKVYKLHDMIVWNYNEIPPGDAYGARDVNITYSLDGETWTALGDTVGFNQAPGDAAYTANTTVAFDGAAAKYVKFTFWSSWEDGLYTGGLSEVRFSAIPTRARIPAPADKAANIALDAVMSWRIGRDAGEHHVYMDTDAGAVTDGTAASVVLQDASYAPELDLAQTYYWRVDEVNMAEAYTTWDGTVWSFSTIQTLVVDGFEVGYDDTDANAVWNTWKDGYGNESVNGASIGYEFPGPYLSTTNHSGGHSAPLRYNNTTAGYSEATAQTVELPIGTNDWTKGNPDTLIIWFRGEPNNASTDQLYMKLNDTKHIYDGDVNDISLTSWVKWEIYLTPLGIDLSDVGSITIGLEKVGTTGGIGLLYLDDIQLTRAGEGTRITVGSTADTYIRDDTVRGDNVFMDIRGGSNDFAGYVRFDLSGFDAQKIVSATLTLTVSGGASRNDTCNGDRFSLYGLNDEAGNTPQNWDEAVLTEANIGLEWTTNNGDPLINITDLDGGVPGIVETTGNSGTVGTRVDVAGSALVNFIKSRVESDGLVTFIIKNDNSQDRGYGLATKENTRPYYRPKLKIIVQQ